MNRLVFLNVVDCNHLCLCPNIIIFIKFEYYMRYSLNLFLILGSVNESK